MVGYNSPGTALQGYVVIPSTNATLNVFLRLLVAEYSGIPITNYNQGYGSDHISWNNAGYPACCWKEFYWSPQYHSAQDKPVHISYPLIHEFVKVGLGFVVELSLAN